MYDSRKQCARVDIIKYSEAKDMELGETVTIVVTGKVRSLRGPEKYMSYDYDDKGKRSAKEVERMSPGSIELEVSSMEISVDGEIEALMKEYGE